jgi:hypothetical protein
MAEEVARALWTKMRQDVDTRETGSISAAGRQCSVSVRLPESMPQDLLSMAQLDTLIMFSLMNAWSAGDAPHIAAITAVESTVDCCITVEYTKTM